MNLQVFHYSLKELIEMKRGENRCPFYGQGSGGAVGFKERGMYRE